MKYKDLKTYIRDLGDTRQLIREMVVGGQEVNIAKVYTQVTKVWANLNSELYKLEKGEEDENISK